MNCGICISFFGVYTAMVNRENVAAVAVGLGRANVHFLNNSAISWRPDKSSIVLNAQGFHVKI
jgi:hypothetical protein